MRLDGRAALVIGRAKNDGATLLGGATGEKHQAAPPDSYLPRCARKETPAAPASTCSRCLHEGVVSDDQNPRTSSGTYAGHDPDKRIRFGCLHCGHEWVMDREEAERHGRFLERAGLNTPRVETPLAVERERAPEQPRPASVHAVLEALADEIHIRTTPAPTEPEPETAAPSDLHAWRLKELADVSAQLADELEPAERRALMQRWADLTLLIGAS